MEPERSGEESARPSASVLIDILIAPSRAFKTIALRRPWLLATLIVVACIVANYLLTIPAVLRVEAIHKLRTSTAFELSANAALQIALLIYSWSIIASIFSNIVARGKPEYWIAYRTFFALAANAAIPLALGSLAGGIAVRIHPAESFDSLAQLANALPFSLAVFASPGNAREVAFLSNFDLTTIWSILLVAYGAHAIGQIKMTAALVVPCSVALALALFSLLPG